MHYFRFHIGDYASHTKHLSPIEDIAYRRMIDIYYLNEQPLNECSTTVARDIGMVDYLDSVDYILNKFFTKKGGAFEHKKIKKELDKYGIFIKNQKRAGRASGKVRGGKGFKEVTTVEQPLNNRSTIVEPTTNHKPLTTNHLTKGQKNRRFTPPSLAEATDYFTERGHLNPSYEAESFVDHFTSNGWKVGGKTPMKDWKATIRQWIRRNLNAVSQPNTRRNERPSERLEREIRERDAEQRGDGRNLAHDDITLRQQVAADSERPGSVARGIEGDHTGNDREGNGQNGCEQS